MTTFELKIPHTTPTGVTYQAGVVGDVIYDHETRDPDGVMRTLVRIGNDTLTVPTASILRGHDGQHDLETCAECRVAAGMAEDQD